MQFVDCGWYKYVGATRVYGGTLIGNIAHGTGLIVVGGAAYENGPVGGAMNLDRTVAALYGNSPSNAGTVDMKGKNLTVPVGDFGAGTITDVGTLFKIGPGTLLVGDVDGVNLDHQEGTLNVASGKLVDLSGSATIANGATLGLVVDTSRESLAADTVNFNSTGALDITGYAGADVYPSTPVTIIKSNTAIAGVPTYTIAGQSSVDFLSAKIQRSADNKELQAAVGLTWYSIDPNRKAHGDFTIDSGTFRLDTALTNQSASTNKRVGWDGNSLTKLGGGTLILSGANTYTGATTVSAGTLQVGNSGTTGSLSSNVALANGTRLVFDRSTASTYSNRISGAGSVTKNGAGTLTLSGDSSTFGGTFTQSAGGIHLAATAALGGTFTQDDGTTFTSASGATLNNATFKGTVTPTGTLSMSTGTFDGATVNFGLLTASNKIVVGNELKLTDSDAIIDADGASGSYTLFEYGTLTVGGINGTTFKNLGDNRGGTYVDAANTALMCDIIVGNTTLYWNDINGETNWNTDSVNRNWTTGNIDTYFKNGDTVVFSHSADTPRTVDITSRGVSVIGMTVSGDYSFSGGPITSTEKLVVDTGASATFSNDIAFGDGIDNAGSMVFNPTTSSILDSSIRGSGTVTKTGSGTLILEGNNTATGTFDHKGGSVDLRSQWTGNYVQQSVAGTFLSGNDATIGGNATFGGDVDPTGRLNVGGYFTLASTGTLHMNVAEDRISAKNITLDGTVEQSSTPIVDPGRQIRYEDVFTTIEAMNTVRMNELLTFTKALVGQTAYFNDPATSMDLVYGTLTVEQFVSGHDLSTNIRRTAELLDAAVAKNPKGTLAKYLYGIDTDAVLEQFLSGSLGGELAADAQTMTLWNPWRKAFDRLYDVNEHYSRGWLGQCGKKRSDREFWGGGYYRSENVYSDGNANGYDGQRGGLTVGVDTKLNSWSLAGFVFGYGNPRVSNGIGRIEADDYTFALYSKVRVVNNLYANAFLGYGRQDYKYRRYAPVNGRRSTTATRCMPAWSFSVR